MHPTLYYPVNLETIVTRLQFCIVVIIVELVVAKLTWLQDKELDVLFLRVTKELVIKATFMSNEDCFVGRGGAADSG